MKKDSQIKGVRSGFLLQTNRVRRCFEIMALHRGPCWYGLVSENHRLCSWIPWDDFSKNYHHCALRKKVYLNLTKRRGCSQILLVEATSGFKSYLPILCPVFSTRTCRPPLKKNASDFPTCVTRVRGVAREYYRPPPYPWAPREQSYDVLDWCIVGSVQSSGFFLGGPEVPKLSSSYLQRISGQCWRRYPPVGLGIVGRKTVSSLDPNPAPHHR